VLQRQVIHESRAVEIGIRADLKIRCRAFRLQPDDVVDRPLLARERAENHFVVSAERASQSSAHPGLHECRCPFVEPPRRILSRAGQITEADRNGIFYIGKDFSAENRAKRPVAAARLIPHHDMRQLMARHQTNPLCRRESFENQVERRDTNLNEIRGKRAGRPVSEILKILKQHGHLAARTVTKGFLVESRRVFKRPDQQGRKIFMGGRVIDDAKPFRLLRIKPRLRPRGRRQNQHQNQPLSTARQQTRSANNLIISRSDRSRTARSCFAQATTRIDSPSSEQAHSPDSS